MIFRALYWIFTAVLRAAEAWDRFLAPSDPEPPQEPRPMFWGWCVECDKPGLISPHWTCERCGSSAVMNVRAGGDETVRA